MILKIKVRAALLSIFASSGLGSRPNSLHPIANFLYWEYLNDWLPVLKRQTKDTNKIVEELIFFATQARSVETNSRDEELAKKIADLDPDDSLTRLMGAVFMLSL